jgi:hypothetical protein
MSSDQDTSNCQACMEVYKVVTPLWEECLCPKLEFQEWHKLECLMGECLDCEVEKKFPICLHESSPSIDWKVSWKCLQQEVVGMNEDGIPKKRVKKCFREKSSSIFFTYLRPNIQKFVKHNFVARCRIPSVDFLWMFCLMILSFPTLIS